jgi:hypothetical protein
MSKPTPPIPISGDADLEKLLKRLSDDIVEAPAFLRLHKLLGVKFGEYEHEVNQSGFFWSLSAKAILEAGLIRLTRIYDQEQSALSLRRLLWTLRSNPHLFEDEAVKRRVNLGYAEEMQPGSHSLDPQKLSLDLKLVSAGDPLVDKIIRWRNTFGAHISPKRMLKEQKLKLNALTRNDAFDLCKRAFEIFNSYTSLYRATTYSTMIIGEEHSADSVFKYLRLGLDAYEKEIDEEYARLLRKS